MKSFAEMLKTVLVQFLFDRLVVLQGTHDAVLIHMQQRTIVTEVIMRCFNTLWWHLDGTHTAQHLCTFSLCCIVVCPSLTLRYISCYALHVYSLYLQYAINACINALATSMPLTSCTDLLMLPVSHHKGN